ncbi:Cytokine receptor-like factor 3 [Microtus ochrogaster]|uniref:Cytokine receptor-like factor 3 n=1 Tax=Microtus ochrogaster TaxID=79684 RepID=A0A8J6GJ58_MICOH|nr:Cytokine receptor-like factor 3 [Microtus ochrogaster]
MRTWRWRRATGGSWASGFRGCGKPRDKESASQKRDVLKHHFSDLKGSLGKLFDERLVTLLQEVDTIEQKTIKPLDDCQKLIEHGVDTADDLVREGEIAIHGGIEEHNDKL